jgi:hypothetical protein
MPIKYYLYELKIVKISLNQDWPTKIVFYANELVNFTVLYALTSGKRDLGYLRHRRDGNSRTAS